MGTRGAPRQSVDQLVCWTDGRISLESPWRRLFVSSETSSLTSLAPCQWGWVREERHCNLRSHFDRVTDLEKDGSCCRRRSCSCLDESCEARPVKAIWVMLLVARRRVSPGRLAEQGIKGRGSSCALVSPAAGIWSSAANSIHRIHP